MTIEPRTETRYVDHGGAANLHIFGAPQIENEATDDYDQPEAITIRCKDMPAALAFEAGFLALHKEHAA